MKINYFAKCLLSFLFFSIFSCKDYDTIPCVPAGLKKNVIAFYPFTKGSIKDFSLDGRDLKMNGSPTPVKDRNGNANCAFSFKRSSNDNLSTNGSFTDGFENKSFSVSMWYQPQNDDNPSQHLYTRLKNNYNRSWSVNLSDCNELFFGNDGTYLSYDLKDSIDCKDNVSKESANWKHVAAIFDGKNFKLYKDGALSKNVVDPAKYGTMTQNIGDIFVGESYTGFIDDIILFNKALTDSEVQTLFGMDTCCQ